MVKWDGVPLNLLSSVVVILSIMLTFEPNTFIHIINVSTLCKFNIGLFHYWPIKAMSVHIQKTLIITKRIYYRRNGPDPLLFIKKYLPCRNSINAS